MNKTLLTWEIMKILMANSHKYTTTAEISRKLEDYFEIKKTVRNIGYNLREINKSYESYNPGRELIKSNPGSDGGYKLPKEVIKDMSRLVSLTLNDEERNALNDSFELATRATNFHYTDDLDKAVDKLYGKFNLKDDDYEYYTGKRNINSITKMLKEIKRAIKEEKFIELSSKFEYFGIPQEKREYKPLYVIHDPDETFVVIRDKNNKDHFQNILNIKEFKVTDQKFSLLAKPNISKYKNDYTIMAKPAHELRFRIKMPRGHAIFELWNYEFEDLDPQSGDMKFVKFHEEYKFFEFMIRIQPYIEVTQISDELKEKWNTIAKRIKPL